ncbi:MAG: 30S ribosomal protein S12 methylthiotransferase RimO [Candidatus Eremiobacterota bacterium]
MKCFFVSLGCPKNLVDSEIMRALLDREGHEITCSEKDAEVIIVNTCGFIESAKEESIETILEMALNKKTGSCKALIVTGCMAQRYSKDMKKEIPEVDAFIGTGEFHRITEVLKNVKEHETIELVSDPEYIWRSDMPRLVSTPFYYAYLKIGEGCSHKCSFCIIPQLRGPYRSRPVKDIVEEARNLAGQGVKEIIIIAQDPTQYGYDLPEKPQLVTLLKEIEQIEGIRWIRILYLYPNSISDELLELIKNSEKICKYIDLPLQHCEHKILKAMGRKGNKEDYLNVIKKIKEKIPDVTLRTALIVGFPGETNEHFESLMDFVEKAEFDRLGAFEYSKEEGTEAEKLKGHVSKKTKKERLHRIMTLQKKISLKKNKSLTGSVQEVIIENISNKGKYKIQGRTRRDTPDIDGYIYLLSSDVQPGDIVKARVTGAKEYDLYGEIITD